MEALPAVRAFAQEHRAEVVLTERPRHASELAAKSLSDGGELIVAVGADSFFQRYAGEGR